MSQSSPVYTNADLVREVIKFTDAAQDVHVAMVESTRKLVAAEQKLSSKLDPSDASVAPAPDKLPRADANGKLDAGWLPDTVTSAVAEQIAEAKDAAQAAQNTATAAQSASSIAQSTANEAKTAADNAQSTANTAKTNAATAQSTADAAKAAADAAKSAAENTNAAINAEAIARQSADSTLEGKIATVMAAQSLFATCDTAGATAAKAISIANFSLSAGTALNLVFSSVNSAANPTLCINGGESSPILYNGMPPEVGALAKNQVYQLIYTGTNWQIMSGMAPWDICQTVFFEDTLSRPGFLAMNGGTVANFSATYPQAAAYLNTTHGAARCFASLSARNSAHTATWASLADGSTVGWNGVGGICKFFWDKSADKLYLPDLVGMFRCMAGDGTTAPSMGGVMGDRSRKVLGSLTNWGVLGSVNEPATGCFYRTSSPKQVGGSGVGCTNLFLDTSRVTPTGESNLPRSWASLATCYLGQKAT